MTVSPHSVLKPIPFADSRQPFAMTFLPFCEAVTHASTDCVCLSEGNLHRLGWGGMTFSGAIEIAAFGGYDSRRRHCTRL